jgi:hypothetical protein
VPLLKSLKEVNLEFVVMDGRTFVTQHPKAMIRWAALHSAQATAAAAAGMYSSSMLKPQHTEQLQACGMLLRTHQPQT